MERYTWVPVFEAITQWLKNYDNRQKELVSILQEIDIDKGLTDKNKRGQEILLEEIDPFTFFAMFMKYGEEKRKSLFASFIEIAKLNVPAPSDFSGVPNTQPLKVWLFPYQRSRKPSSIPILWRLFHAAENKKIDNKLFSDALSIKGTGFAKLTQCLFYAYPDKYFPVDSQTRGWLIEHGIDIPDQNWESYSNCLDAIKAHTKEPFWKISYYSWYSNQKQPFDSEKAVEYLMEQFSDTYSGTSHMAAFTCANGRQIAIDPKIKAVKVFIDRKPPTEIGLYSITKYDENKTRNHHLKQHAPSLSVGNTAYYVVIPKIEDLIKLCDWYSGEDGESKSIVQESKGNNYHEREISMPAFPLNQILYGPPGTGKTYSSTELAVRIAEPEWFSEQTELLDNAAQRPLVKQKYDELVSQDRIVLTSFHQSFAYEDFIEGIRATPDEEGKAISYTLEDGVFKQLCINADNRIIKHDPLAKDDIASKTVWKMSLGNTQSEEGKAVFKDCIDNDYVLLGWGGDVDFSGCESIDQVKAKYQTRYPDEVRDYAFSSVFRFKQEVKVGDLIIASAGNTRFQGIAEVIGDYHLLDEGEDTEFYQARNVRWLQVYSHSRPVSDIYQSNFQQKTLYRLQPDKLDFEALGQMLNDESPSNEALPHVLIIDEINRGNISRIFGELITLLEPSKRAGAPDAQTAILPYSKKPFSVPGNVYVIGTMNTADKSLAQLDLALRRRFSFVEMLPEPELLSGITVYGVNIVDLLTVINQRIEVLLDQDHLIGHSYFMSLMGCPDEASRQVELARIFRENILPLLQEYFFDDYERIGWVLNDPQKPAEYRFIDSPKGTTPVTQLFDSTIAEQISDRRYRINSEAFQQAGAYQGIGMVATNEVV